ncbi:MAG: N(4)-(beta-N-acetylglucosaminyl)-L-asparaginase [Anaerolineae bacterium]
MTVLRQGGSALDAVEAGIRAVESNPDEHSVGYGGLPNLLGEVEVDASIMDGRTLMAGAVGAVKGYEHAISIARRVMEHLPHVMLVGSGAERFAAEMGFVKKELLTKEAREIWEGKLRDKLSPDEQEMVRRFERLGELVRLAADPEKAQGTTNFIAQDARGDIASGVSTSGWSWKYPGRLGDSPIIGAGNYADNRYGAATCTGYGEMAIRCSTARSVVLYIKMGLSLEGACREALEDLRTLTTPFPGGMHILAMDREGHHLGVTNEKDREVFYIFMTDKMSRPETKPRLVMA